MSPARLDVVRYRSDFEGRDLSAFGMALRSVGLQAVLVYRLGRWLQSGPAWHRVAAAPGWALYLLGKLLVCLAYDIRIDLSASIGPGLYVGHFGGIWLRNCTLGTWCSVAQEVHIGNAVRTPGTVIGDRVWIGAHAEIVAPVRIGSGATIAAGSRVESDVPAGVLVGGRPARALKKSYDNRAILKWPSELEISSAPVTAHS